MSKVIQKINKQSRMDKKPLKHDKKKNTHKKIPNQSKTTKQNQPTLRSYLGY